MAINKKINSVVSSSSSGPVVHGRRKPRGRVIGEMRRGAYVNHKTLDTGRYSRAGDGYSDFGLDDGYDDFSTEGDFQYSPSIEGNQYPGSAPGDAAPLSREVWHDGKTRQRQDEFNIPSILIKAVFVALGGLPTAVVLAFLYFFIADGFGADNPFLFWVAVPVILAFYSGTKAGANARKSFRKGFAILPSALGGAALACLVIAGLFRLAFTEFPIYPSMVLIQIFDTPYELAVIGMEIDRFILKPFEMFSDGAFMVIPLSGAALGWLFTKKR